MPNLFSYSFNVVWKDKFVNYTSYTTCREVALRDLSVRIDQRVQHTPLKTELLESEFYIEASTKFQEYRPEHIQEIVDAFSNFKDGATMALDKEARDRFTGGSNFIGTFKGPQALPAWYWLVLATRPAIVQTGAQTLSEAIAVTDKVDRSCWYHTRDRDATWRAWERIKRGRGPTSKQMIYFMVGPVSWYNVRGKKEMP